jgi:hypothetical protein
MVPEVITAQDIWSQPFFFLKLKNFSAPYSTEHGAHNSKQITYRREFRAPYRALSAWQSTNHLPQGVSCTVQSTERITINKSPTAGSFVHRT